MSTWLWPIAPVVPLLGSLFYARRHSFPIDVQGCIVRIYRNVDADTHYRRILDDLARVTPKPNE